MSCFECENKNEVPGDCHIQCNNPPNHQEEIGSGGDERYIQAKERATTNKSVVRCIWPGSGVFPFNFDGGTVFGCSNFKEVVVKPQK